MIKDFIVKSKTGLLIGTIVGIIFLFCFFLIQPPAPSFSSISDIIWFIIFFFPIILSGAISGAIIEILYIKKYILSKKLLAAYKEGSISGCIIGSLSFFHIGVFWGVITHGFPGFIIISLPFFLINKFLKKITGTSFDWESIGKILLVSSLTLGIILVTVLITLIMAAIGTLAGLLLNIVIRKTITRLLTEHQNKFFGFHFGEKEIKIAEILLVIISTGFIFVGFSYFLFNSF